MMDKKLLENIKKTIVFLGRVDEKIDEQGNKQQAVSLVGTGFLLSLNGNIFLATAKHVIANINPKTGKVIDEKKNLLVSNNLKQKGNVRYSSLDQLRDNFGFIYHADDKVDIALIPFPIDGEKDDLMACDSGAFVDTGEVFETYDVFFGSYQPGISDLRQDSKVFPVIRRGTIARINSDDSIYIDGSAFPGNSGSPVFMMPSAIRYTGNSVAIGSDTVGGKFLGIISQYKPYSEVAVSQQTGRARVVFEENTGLSMLWSNKYIKEIMKSDEFKNVLKKIKNNHEKN